MQLAVPDPNLLRTGSTALTRTLATKGQPTLAGVCCGFIRGYFRTPNSKPTPLLAVGLSAGLCRRLKRNIPAGKYEHRRVTLEGARKNLCPFYAEIDPAILYGGNGGLGNPGEFRDLALAQFLEFAKNPDRFAHGNFDSLFGRTKFFQIRTSGNHGV